MRLLSLRLFGLGPLSGVALTLAQDDVPRPMTVLFGADGVGKTTLLTAIASTRPGYALPLLPRARVRVNDEEEEEGRTFALTEWVLGDDDIERPHPLRVASPNAQLGEGDGEAQLRRREQALFDRRAQEEGGYVMLSFSGARWFSRTPALLTSPERTLLRYDVRAAPTFDDATRADLARETKQVLAFAALAAAFEQRSGEMGRFSTFDNALRDACKILLHPFGIEARGVHLPSLEPIFSYDDRTCGFDDLPRGARHLIAIATLTTRALFAAYEASARPIREREGVVVIDDLEMQQDTLVLRLLPSLFRRAFPRVQWIVATAQSAVTLDCERDEVIALRRDEGRIVLHEGALAVLH